MKVPFLDLKVTDSNHKKSLLRNLKDILEHGRVIEGPELFEFEKKMANYLKTKHVVGLSSGSSAIYLALKALNVKKGDEVITTPFTWIITVNAILEVGAKPIFVDIKDDFNIDPEKIASKITKKTKAIVPMHVGGHMCEMEKISQIAKKNNLYVVEDAAQAIVSSLNKKKAGYFSDISAFSTNPMKMLNGLGESGFVSTRNTNLKKKILYLRHAGTVRDKKKIHINNCVEGSLNHKMDTLQASFLITNLKKLETKRKKRENFAKIYDNELKNYLEPQGYHKNEIHGRYLYISKSDKRNDLYNFLLNKNIECKIFYSPLACNAPIFKKNNYKGKFKNADKLLKRSISLPLYENLSNSQIEYVCDNVKKFFRNKFK